MLSRATCVATATLAIGAAVAGIGFAAPAHADDQSFLNDLAQNHIGTGGLTDPLAVGRFICVRLRDGLSPAEAAHLCRGGVSTCQALLPPRSMICARTRCTEEPRRFNPRLSS
jgi:hypothetical protein